MTHEQDKDKLLNAYFQDQTIAPDGKLRPTFSRLVERADKAEAELARLTALLEDRERLAGILYDAAHQGFGEMDWFGLSEHYKPKWRKVADRLIAYLKPLG